jgi:prophage regulatory protein
MAQQPAPHPSPILRRHQVERLTGLSYSTIFRKERRGEFPARIRLGPNSVGYRESEVLAWIDTRERIATPNYADIKG